MAVLISYCCETTNDYLTPLTIAEALINNRPRFTIDELEELSSHLSTYVKRKKGGMMDEQC